MGPNQREAAVIEFCLVYAPDLNRDGPGGWDPRPYRVDHGYWSDKYSGLK